MMNVLVYERMPRPGPDPGRWGYLANAYVRPAHRGAADALLLREHPGTRH